MLKNLVHLSSVYLCILKRRCAIFRETRVHVRLLRSCNYVVARTCPMECRSRDEIQNRGKQKVALENPYEPRYPDRSLYIRSYSDSKEVSFYPYHETAYGPVSLSSISYLSWYPAFSSPAGSFRWHVIRRFRSDSRERIADWNIFHPMHHI